MVGDGFTLGSMHRLKATSGVRLEEALLGHSAGLEEAVCLAATPASLSLSLRHCCQSRSQRLLLTTSQCQHDPLTSVFTITTAQDTSHVLTDYHRDNIVSDCSEHLSTIVLQEGSGLKVARNDEIPTLVN